MAKKLVMKGKAKNKPTVKGGLKTKKGPRMSPEEKRLAREWHFDRGMSRTAVAEALGRDLSSIVRLLNQKKAPAPIGRPRALTTEQESNLVKLLEKMVKEANAGYEVTLAMLMKRSRVKVAARVVANAIHKHGYYFRDLRHQLVAASPQVERRFSPVGAVDPGLTLKCVHYL